MKRLIATLLVFTSLLPLFAGGQKETAAAADSSPVVVFAAASTTDVMQSLADLYKQQTGQEVVLNPASSGTLAKQLNEGAQADLYISASKKWMDYAVDQGLVADSIPFAGNRIVLIAPADSSDPAVDLTKDFDFPGSFTGRLSMGDPAHVPAGAYAKKSLEYLGWYDQLADRIQPATDVRAAMAVVELGECDRGIVYSTDAKKSAKVKILGTFPAESHDPISYFLASLKTASPQGKAFYDFVVKSSDTSKILKQYGFEPAK